MRGHLGMIETLKAETPTLVSDLMGLVVLVQDNYGFFQCCQRQNIVSPCSIVGSLVTFELHKNNLLSSKLFTTTSIFGVTHLFFVTKAIEKNHTFHSQCCASQNEMLIRSLKQCADSEPLHCSVL